MSIELNHTIVPAHDPKASAQFLARILGLTVDPLVAHFTPITLANRATLDYDQIEDFESHHYAFLVSDEECEEGYSRTSFVMPSLPGMTACLDKGWPVSRKDVVTTQRP